MKTHNRKSRLGFESLEGRQMLAGNVTAAVVAGDLVIEGDSKANIISMRELSGDRWEIIGGGTKVNGSYSKFVTGPVTGDILIEMNGGADVVTIQKGTIEGSLAMDMSSGNDVATLVKLNVDGDVAFSGGSGNDVLSAARLNATDVAIEMGSGVDAVALDRLVAEDLAIALGSGNDALAIVNSGLQNVAIDGDSGTDAIALTKVAVEELLAVDTGSGNYDSLVLTQVTADENGLVGGGGKGDTLVRISSSLGTAVPGTPTGFEFVV